MKICLITDQHFGARSNSIPINNIQERFYREIFFPYIDNNSISRVVNLGDIFDQRKNTNTYILQKSKEFFFDEISKRNIIFDNIIGNHCTFFKNTNDVNTPSELLEEYNFNIYTGPTDIYIDGTKIGILPWICSGNYDESIEYINNTKSKIILGHLEIQGFEMYKGYKNTHGLSTSLFNKFDYVFSGHFHHKSTKGNITYLGAPYEMCWNDYDDPRGFHIFDTDTNELEFIENPYRTFLKLEYDDTDKKIEDVLDIDTNILKNTYIKIIVKNCSSKLWLDKYKEKIEKAGAIEISVIDFTQNNNIITTINSDEVEDTKTILKDVIMALDKPLEEKIKIDNLLEGIYNEAINS